MISYIRYDSLVYEADLIVDYPLEYYSNQGVIRKKNMPRLTDINQIYDYCRLFVKTDLLPSLVYFLNQLTKPIHLITGNSDITPAHDLMRLLLDNKYIKSWVSNHISNIDKKILQIPAGFQEFGANRSNWSTYPESGTKDIKCLITPLGNTNPNRSELDSVYFEGLVRITNRLDYKDYIEYLGRSKYTFCPAGNAVDSHRVCESIVMNSIPIVKNSILDPMYKEMGCLIVNNWNDINFKDIELDSKKVTLAFWQDKINNHQIKLRN